MVKLFTYLSNIELVFQYSVNSSVNFLIRTKSTRFSAKLFMLRRAIWGKVVTGVGQFASGQFLANVTESTNAPKSVGTGESRYIR